MTRAATDPADVLTDAAHELLAELERMLAEHPDGQAAPDDVPAMLDRLTVVLRRARGRVARAAKRAERVPVPTPASSTAATVVSPAAAPTPDVRLDITRTAECARTAANDSHGGTCQQPKGKIVTSPDQSAPQPPSGQPPTWPSQAGPSPTPVPRKGRLRKVLPWLVAGLAFFVGIGIGAAGSDPAASTAAGSTSAARPSVDPAVIDKRQNERKAQLDEREAQLNRREDTLKAREAALQTQEAAVRENTIPGEGVYVVGQDVKPGTYRTAGPTSDICYYALKSGTGSDADILDNNIIKGAGSVTLKDRQVFETNGCQDWTLR